MKKNIISILTVGFLILLLTLAGCNIDTSSGIDAFIGEFKSTHIDAQVPNKSLSFILEMKEDKTFKVTRKKDGATEWSINGEWKTKTENGIINILCLITDSRSFNDHYRNTLYPYFILSAFDDGH